MGAHWLHINVVSNWQLSKQGIRWPVSPDPLAGSGVDPSRSSIFSEVIRWQVTSFQMIAGSFLIHMKYVVFISLRPSAINILMSNSPGTRKFSKNASREDAFHFSHHSHALVTLHVQFLCYDWSKFDRWVHGENLCSILRLVYFDRVLCQLVMFLTVFFHWMYKMKFSCYQEFSVIHGWFIYWIFGWEMRHLSKSEIRFRMASFLFCTLLDK